MTVFALVDCNNFYVSCQRVFNPALENRPVVVLSNNDGCIIARSNEAKELGIPMGAPYFKYRPFCEKNKVFVFSSNYELYGDLSQRVMTSLRHFCPELEVYSIDEAFLRLDSVGGDLKEFCAVIREKIKMWTGIPVSIGIGPTKTLAKAANRIAKRKTLCGVFDLRAASVRDAILAQFEVIDLWGISHQSSKKLAKLGITTAAQLRDSPADRIRRHFGVVGERLMMELNGISCLGMENVKPRKNIISSRSFGKVVTDLVELEEAVSHYASIAGVKLRKQQSRAQGVYVFLQTGLYHSGETPYSNGIFSGFAQPSADTGFIIQVAKKLLKKIYIPDLRYKKAGIMLTDIVPNTYQQYDLLIGADSRDKKDRLMQTLDIINDRMGRQSVFLAAEGIHQPWRINAERKSARFTTQWQDILTIQV